MIRPPRLQPGDTVGLVSPSWGGAGMFPHRVERGVQHLQSLGFKVRIGRHALNQRGFVSDTPQNRVDDIHSMFGDSEVKAMVAAMLYHLSVGNYSASRGFSQDGVAHSGRPT